MKLLAPLVLLAGVAACTQERRVDAESLRACDELELSEGLVPGECRLEANGETLRVKFSAPPEGATGGVVSIDVVGSDRSVRQVLLEENVSEYLAPSIQDIDGDGRGDVLIPRESGNVNVAHAVWVFSDEGLYRRAGEVSGVQIERTDEGLIAVPARTSAASWNIAFHRLDGNGLSLIASVNVEAEAQRGGALSVRCELADAPGLALLDLTTAAAETKFCAEPIVAGVFGP